MSTHLRKNVLLLLLLSWGVTACSTPKPQANVNSQAAVKAISSRTMQDVLHYNETQRKHPQQHSSLEKPTKSHYCLLQRPAKSVCEQVDSSDAAYAACFVLPTCPKSSADLANEQAKRFEKRFLNLP